MGGRSTPAQSVKAEAAAVEIEFCADEAMRPVLGHEPGACKQADVAGVVAAAQENELAAQGCGGLEDKAGGPGTARGCGGDFCGVLGSKGGDKGGAAPGEGGEMAVLEAVPDARLPAGIVALDLGLEAGFARRREDRRDAEREAEADDAPDGVRVLVRALEKRVIVELGEARQTMRLPAGAEAGEHMVGEKGAALRPGSRQAAVEGHGIEHLDVRPALDEQALDHVEGIEFRAARGEGAQIPAARRRRAAHAQPGIEQPSADEHAANGAQRRHGALARPRCQQACADGSGAAFTQRGERQRAARGEDGALDPGRDAIGRRARPCATVSPHHAVEPPAPSAQEPELKMGKTDTKAPRHRTHGLAAAHREDHLPTLPSREFFMARRATPPRLACGAGSATDSLRSSSALPAPQANPPPSTDQLLLALK